MSLHTRLKPDTYVDSVRLMKISESLPELEGISEGSVGMGTDSNKSLFDEKELLSDELESASPGDLMIALEAADESAAQQAFQRIESTLQGSESDPGQTRAEERAPITLDRALDRQPDSNLALISVPGQYAWMEALKALNRDMNVLLFSDNVPVEKEVQLKEKAREQGLLLMGPDAGTALINGVPLGFANDIRPGPVGLVSASGTGLQEISSLIHRGGSGITQGIGVGGKDLSSKVGGIMMLQGLEYLSSDPDTEVIVLISKPPARDVAEKILNRAAEVPEPVIVNFLGYADPESPGDEDYQLARTLQEAAELALGTVQGEPFTFDGDSFDARIEDLRSTTDNMSSSQQYIRGLFAGGTLCSEAELLLADRLTDVFSNVSPEDSRRLDDPWTSRAHSCVDLGEDDFTEGRAHPMIDPGIRQERILEEARDPQTAILMLDIPLGYGAHENPAGALAPQIREARQTVRSDGGELLVLAHVCGTDQDPQDLHKQEKIVRDAGGHVLETNSQMARAASDLCVDASPSTHRE